MAALTKRLLFPILTLTLALAASSAAVAKGPVRAASTLLSLYTRSDAIMIGRFNKREEIGTNRVGEGFTAVTTRTYFDVSTVLKGGPRKFVVIEDEEFRYQIFRENDAPRQAVFVDDLESLDAEAQPIPGDTVMLFLKGTGDSFELADGRDGVRKISAETESVLTDRVKELNAIFESDIVEPAKITAWLVRCAAHPATRWDGTHELLQGLRRLDWESQKDADGYERIDPAVSIRYGSEAAKLLDDGMRSSLTHILAASGVGNGSVKPLLTAGDRELITLVKRWDPITAAVHLLSLVRSRAYPTRENAGMMVRIAELLNDDKISKAAGRYANISDSEQGNDSDALRMNALDNFIRVTCGHLAEYAAQKGQ